MRFLYLGNLRQIRYPISPGTSLSVAVQKHAGIPVPAPAGVESPKVLNRRTPPTVSPYIQAVDLFCGAGGISEGMRMAGFQSILGIDVWEPACRTFALNHETATTVCGDIAKLDGADLIRLAGLEPGVVGLVSGGPPCQGFSLAGKTLADDPRNYLYREFLRVVEAFAPQWVIMENVPQLLKHPEVAQAVHRDLRSLRLPAEQRYDVQHFVANAADYGVPQTRSRVIFVAKRGDVPLREEFDLPKAMRAVFVEPSGSADLFNPTYVTVSEAINDLPAIRAGEGSDAMSYTGEAETPYQKFMRGEIGLAPFFESKNLNAPLFTAPVDSSNAVYNHVAQKHSALLVERFDNIPAGGSKEDLRRSRPDLLPPEGHPDQGLTYGRLWTDRPAPTIPANYSRPSGNRSIHPTIPRLITPREAMRLSSFPDAYRLTGGMVAQREQVGNAVPPLLVFHIANYIRRISTA
jgi:DNA (cytosine-5)-methyltransferase 1